jgi:hypothetical protein
VRHRVRDHAGLGPLDEVDLLRLLLDREVAVQHAEPPWRAIAIAIRASVTVSIAADSSGTATRIRRLTGDEVSAELGMTSLSPAGAGRRRR